MFDPVTLKANELSGRFGRQALVEAELLLAEATASMNHRQGIFYADVCEELRERIPQSSSWYARWRRLRRLFRD
jgi:hypothetical protein